MRKYRYLILLITLMLGGLPQLFSPGAAHAGNTYFNTPSGAVCIMQELRWPYANAAVYNPCFSQFTSGEGGANYYFYHGNVIPGTGQTAQMNFSTWPIGSPLQPGDSPTFVYTAPNMNSTFGTGEGVSGHAGGMWTFRTNQWYRYALRLWTPADGTPHVTYMGSWLKDTVTGVWSHSATVKVPFVMTSMGGNVSGFQENFGGSTTSWRTDYRNCYYYTGSGAWQGANQFTGGANGGWLVNCSNIEGATAAMLECCPSNNTYVGTPFNSNITVTMTNQPASPTFDPLLVSNVIASISGSQLLVQWQVTNTSSPQLGYRVEVFNNSGYTGSPSVSFYDRDPEARQKLLDITGVTTPYVRVTFSDIFDNTNSPILITPSAAVLNPATNVVGAVSGLAYKYYESATNYVVLPDFTVLTPVLQGAVNYPDISPRRTRTKYAFNFNGFINAPSNGLYTFTLNSYDGSKLTIDGTLIADNDGQHSAGSVTGTAPLAAGKHAINVQYFMDWQYSSFNDVISLSWSGPGIASALVPDSAYYRVPVAGEPALTLTAPADSTIHSGSNLTLTASVTANGNTINNVQFYSANRYAANDDFMFDNFLGQDSTAPYSMNLPFWAATANVIRARVTYNGTNTLDSVVTASATTNMTVAPWLFTPLNMHICQPGAIVQGGKLTLVGDAMNLLSRQVTGDCTIVGRLAALPSLGGPDGSSAQWVEAGIILRGTTNATPGWPLGIGSTKFAAVHGTPSSTYFQDSTMSNGGGAYTSANLGGGNRWFKIERVDDTFTSYVSADGANWTSVNTNTLAGIGSTIYVGVFSYSQPSLNPNIAWAVLDNVSITGAVVGPPDVTITPGSANLFSGQSATFAANVIGNPPFTFQWQRNGAAIAGETNATYTLTNAQLGDSGLYTVAVTAANGTDTSAPATVVVMTPPAGTTAYTALVLSNGPFAYWRMNEGSGTTMIDSSGNAKNGNYVSATLAQPGPQPPGFPGLENTNRAVTFNGTTTKGNVGTSGSLNGTVDFTVMAWVKTTAGGVVVQQRDNGGVGFNGQYQFSVSGGVHFFVYNNGTYQFNITSSQSVSDGQWHHIAGVRSGVNGYIYVDGVLSASDSGTYETLNSAIGTYVGYNQRDNSGYFNGSLDEVTIFNKALSETAIQNLYQTGAVPPPSLVTLTGPTNGAMFSASVTIPLAATVNTNGHSIVKVQFLNGPALLGEDAAAPYSLNWSNVAAGTYTVLAQMVYDGTNVMASTPVFISVINPPTAPQTLTASALGTNLIAVNWTAASEATGYILRRDGSPIANLAGTSYQDYSVSPGVTYCYSVVATNGFGNSSPSSTNCATTPVLGAALQWDADSAITAAQDGAGNWGGSAPTWWSGSTNIGWANTNLAMIGSTTATNATITITNNVSVSGIIFNATGGGSYTVAGSGGALNLVAASTITADNNATISATLQGGGLVKTGAATLTLSGTNSSTGGATVNAGTLKLTGTVATLGSGNITNNATLEWNTASASRIISSINAFAGAGLFLKSGANNLQLQGANASTFSGTVSVAGGLFILDTATGFENGAPNLDLSGGDIVLGTAFDGGTATFGNLSGGGQVRMDWGATSVTRTLSLNQTGNTTYSGVIGFRSTQPNRIMNVIKTGAGALTLTGTGIYTGTTAINGGTLLVDGILTTNTTSTVTLATNATLGGTGVINGATTVQNGGTLSPGDDGVGKLTVSNNVIFNSGGRALMKLARNGGVTTNDLLFVSGTLNRNGSLIVTNTGTDALAAGDSFTLFSAGTLAGVFTTLSLPPLTGGLGWSTNTFATNGTLAVVISLPLAVTNVTMVANGGPFTLAGTGTAGQRYVLLCATNLPASTWTPVLTNTADTNGIFQFTDTQATNFPQRFYRVQGN